MTLVNGQVTPEQIESFLEGYDPQKYIIAIEPDFKRPVVTLIINDPERGKYTEEHKFEPFIWFKEDITKVLYGGKRLEIIEAKNKYEIKFKKLKTYNEKGVTPYRLENGYKYIAQTKKSYNDLINFFKEGGIDIFDKEVIKMFIMFSPVEQFMIQTGKRLFKGLDNYDDLHRFQFDLETEGLYATRDSIFQIGMRDNKNFEHVLEVVGNTPFEKRESEREMIDKFFKVIDIIKPDIITGYNSENFDWPFLFERAERLGMNISDLAITLNRLSKIKRKPSTLKLGGETESYEQTYMYGYNILDVSHSVRRAMAINSEIKGWGLKYITQYSGIAKPNRVYIPGDKINQTWLDKINKYAFNDTNGDWYIINDKSPLKEGYTIVSGDYIVKRYLCDDLWETEQIDNLYNQASFLIAKILPTNFVRSSTMGTAGQWKLIMSAWSYENDLAIPETQEKRNFTGGLSRLLEVGYAKNVVKLDFAALYPKAQLTWDIFPDLDISGVMKGILTYIVDTRDKFKLLTGLEKNKIKELKELLKGNEDSKIIKEINEHKQLEILYDKKQLPLKILANSWFGSYGAPYIFNWGDTDSAEETTCRGRQSLRLMVKYFTERYGFKPLVLDTDGCNFSYPTNIDEIKYTPIGNHWKTEKYKDIELSGLEAVLAEFNEKNMEGRMGLDIDDICKSTINLSRKNYANDIDGKIKLVGNSIKSNKMPVYIEEFLNKGIRMLLDGDGYSFINYYYDYVNKIYNYQIPLVKILTKAKIKTTLNDYKKKATMKNKAGNSMPKQAHMELALKNKLEVKLGDIIFYINTGDSKTQGDLKTINKSKMSKKEIERYIEKYGVEPPTENTVQLNCKLINREIVERDFDRIKELEVLKKSLDKITFESSKIEIKEKIKEIETSLFTDEYNVDKYLESFNKKVKPLLVCFKPEIRDSIILDIIKIKNKETKEITEELKTPTIFTRVECELISGVPLKDGDQDSYLELMTMEDKEIKFWDKITKTPNFMSEEEWFKIKKDYHERMEKAKENGILDEKHKLWEIFKHLEVYDLRKIIDDCKLPIDILTICDISNDEKGNLISRKWNEILCNINDIFTYEKEAIIRNIFYKKNGLENIENKYEIWLNKLAEDKVLLGEVEISENNNNFLLDKSKLKIKTEIEKIILETPKVRKKYSENNEDSEDNDETNGLNDEEIKLDDEYDDTIILKPEEINTNDEVKILNDDEWPF